MATTANAQPRPATSPPKRNRTLLIILAVIVALVAALVGAELYVRHSVKQCMADQFQSELGSKVAVDLSAKPMLLQVLDKSVPYIEVTSDDSSFGPAQDMHVKARVNDVDLTNAGTTGATVGSSTAEVDWSTAGILATLQAQPFGRLITGVTSDATAGTLQFQILGLAELTVRPQASGGAITVEAVGAELLGLGIPTDLVSGVVDVLTSTLQTFPLGMTADSLTMTDTGLQMTLSGDAYTMPVADPNAAQVDVPSSCALLT
ncbi:DUF2993 domain-containing protein [Rhodococcus kronopolitis]|uniref:DUF2993 domain-containing protein n=1 Tax=Rhodococcus kronopolitis TaxID=1460226 RepID=A0ABV9FW36_9NOCA